MSMCKCFKQRNIIILECWNWTKDEVIWWWGKWTNGKFALGKWNISIGYWSINGHHFLNMHHTEKFQIMLKTFMHGHAHIMTFLHLKVHNGWCKFFIGSVFQIFHWLSFPCHIRFMHGHSCVMIFLHFIPKSAKKICQNRLTHLCVTMVNHLGNSSSHVCVGVCVYVCIYTDISNCPETSMHVCVCMCVCVCVCVYVCLHIHISNYLVTSMNLYMYVCVQTSVTIPLLVCLCVCKHE